MDEGVYGFDGAGMKWLHSFEFEYEYSEQDYRHNVLILSTKAAEIMRKNPEAFREEDMFVFADDFEDLARRVQNTSIPEYELVKEYDEFLSELYDYCDEERIWYHPIRVYPMEQSAT